MCFWAISMQESAKCTCTILTAIPAKQSRIDMFLVCFESINYCFFIEKLAVNIYCIVCKPVVIILMNIDYIVREVSMQT